MNSDLPVIAIITVVYNGRETLESTIECVLNLAYKNIDFIIIDGGSDDGSVEIIKKYAHRIYYWISEPDAGIYDAMNKGWARAKEDSYIIFLGSGDKIISLPNMLLYKDYNVIFGGVFMGNILFKSSVGPKLKLGNTIHHQALFIKKSIHPSAPFSLDYPIYADFDFNQKLYKKKVPFIKAEGFYASALEGGISSVRREQEMLDVIERNFGIFYRLLAKIYYKLQYFKSYGLFVFKSISNDKG